MSEYRRRPEEGRATTSAAPAGRGLGDAVAPPPPPPHAAIITTEFTAAGDVGDYDDDKKEAEAFAAEAGVSVEAVSVAVWRRPSRSPSRSSERRRRRRRRRDEAADQARRQGCGHHLRGRRRHRRGDRLRPGGHQPSGHAPPPPPPPVVVAEEARSGCLRGTWGCGRTKTCTTSGAPSPSTSSPPPSSTPPTTSTRTPTTPTPPR